MALRRSPFIGRVITVAAFVAVGWAGYASRGWLGLLLYPFLLLVALIVLWIVLMILDVIFSLRRTRKKMRSIESRLGDLSDTELESILASPESPDMEMAIVILARRGIDKKPEKQLLLEMLTSPKSSTRWRAMTLVEVCYPELRFPEGCSSADPPEAWRKHVAAMTSPPAPSA